jgi:HAMP domain-containing protein
VAVRLLPAGSWLIASGTTRTLAVLRRVRRALAAGDPLGRVGITNRDDLGLMAGELGSATTSLRDTINEVSALLRTLSVDGRRGTVAR